ncbi:MAG: hypothetical protein Q7V62_15210 [Actinomycetota bacterium]|nr:hypothetical protein [Actinomycetota bacterium]
MNIIFVVLIVIPAVCVATLFVCVVARAEQDRVEWTQFHDAYMYASEKEQIRMRAALRDRSFIKHLLKRAPRDA